MTIAAATGAILDEKYLRSRGRVYMTGTQALVRLLLAQKERDAAAGLNTGGFVSGYRGSPLGSVDLELWKARKHLKAHNISFVPGLNEELAATAVWGSQMVSLDAKATVDGVFGLWYGKGPGVDRSGDVFKHGNLAGTSQHGGVLLIAGDDHACKSSTLPHQSEHAFIAAIIPVLNPSSVREFIEFGLHGFAMSRYSGCWIGFKTTSDTIETSASFDVDPLAVEIRIPDSYPIPPDGFHFRWPDPPLEQENRLQRERVYALLEYVRLNRLNRQDWSAPRARLGIITTGKSYQDVREALKLLGIDVAAAQSLGIRLLKMGLSWPLEPQCVREFADGLDEILVVEEKRQVIEYQLKEQLYNMASRPRVVGKYDETGEWVKVPHDGILLSPNGELTPATVARVIALRINKVFGAAALPAAAREFLGTCRALEAHAGEGAELPKRVPYFCAGCPHNTSTNVPEGSRAIAGIGCHYMVRWMNRHTDTFTQMGGEGVTWVGQAPFTATGHVFANLGDGTYMHSGSLAIRAALAAGVNITYKILYNDAVAMTGGQPVEGKPTAQRMLQQVAAEGVKHLYLLTDNPTVYAGDAGLPAGTIVRHRDDIDTVQKQMRELPGVSVLMYVQTCAAEKRRRRKRNLMPDPPKRVLINEEVCEGCGDCGVQSNCVAIIPVETALGRKRAIDQSSCNKDYSCVKGFCPSFVTVEGGALRKRAGSSAAPPANLPLPSLPPPDAANNILVTGVGGTGVVTIGALLGMAAHLEGKGVLVLDMAGLAQKGGAVTSHVRIAASPSELNAARISPAGADVLLGCDLMVSSGDDAIDTLSHQRTRALINTDVAPTGEFTQQPDWQASAPAMLERVRGSVRELAPVDATRLSVALLGDALGTNMFMLGFAWQRGWIALSESSLQQAIEINGAAVEMNRAAFAWGRLAAVDLPAVHVAAGLQDQSAAVAEIMPLAELIADRVQRLTGYQNAAYAARYAGMVREIAAAERARVGGERLAREVAISLYKLMAYKDEYEVGRLFTDTGFYGRVAGQFIGNYRLRFHLAPPLFARRDSQGRLIKQQYGAWMRHAFALLSSLRWLRGSWADPFGYSAERRAERAAIGEYEQSMRSVAQQLNAGNLETALELARLPQTVRGYGHVKERNAQQAEVRRQQLTSQLALGQ
jgi:indolepyruvate ferredoxin oxidoreductase